VSKEQPDSRFRGKDEKEEARPPRWMVEFLATLMVTGSVKEAVEASGAELEAILLLRRLEPAFAKYWDKAVRLYRSRALLAFAEGEHWGPVQ
jgi:hypothetical protein